MSVLGTVSVPAAGAAGPEDGISAEAAATQDPHLRPRQAPDKPARAAVPAGHARDRLHVKFVEGSEVRLRGGQFVSLGGDDLAPLHAVLQGHPTVRGERLFTRPEPELAREKGRIERRSHRAQADKNLYFRLLLGPRTDPVALLDDLNRLELVEIAYAEPLPAPPTSTELTPDFTARQHYARAATGGVDADHAWTEPGGRGRNVKIVDIEYAWNQAHEDVTKAVHALIPNGTPASPFSDDHGTAVIGQLVADDNGLGITGLVPEADLGLVNEYNRERGSDRANAIDRAHAALAAGDVMLLEMQTWGAYGGTDYVPVEWVPALYDAIVAATSDGVIVVEAAGNGNQNLDDAVYGAPFPRGMPDSGAIIVGAGGVAGCSTERARLGFSSFGSRVNVQASGQCVTTTGYGGLQGGADRNRWYTPQFSGTSSASPIAASAAAAVSSVAQERGVMLNPVQVRDLLVSTGSPQVLTAASGHIGPQPDLRAALEALPRPSGCASDVGVEMVADRVSGPDPVSAGATAQWTVSMTITACEDVTGLRAQGGTPAWASTTGSADIGALTVRKVNRNNQVLEWAIPDLSRGATVKATLSITGTVGRKAACGSTAELTGMWSVTATARQADAIPIKYDQVDPINATVGGTTC